MPDELSQFADDLGKHLESIKNLDRVAALEQENKELRQAFRMLVDGVNRLVALVSCDESEQILDKLQKEMPWLKSPFGQ